ncbi:carboxypeptidase regulatory-like domain-containing protein [Geomonas ferrireducens]|uniref:carboxypeptidase regulatory-like domain-containing protein n=1 Tax=Geomonas ferrireducens TaxID=2570227 RepID=UPI0010A7A508|nr:carboxypeptidase regulatory-like domain-containing protein [Geomonas ferrireducens]
MLFNIFKRFNVVSAAGTALAGALVALVLLLAPQAALATVATGTLTTSHWKQGTSEGYSITATVTVPLAQKGSAQMYISGAQVSSTALVEDTAGTTYSLTFPVASRPALNEAYTVDITYFDNPDTPTPPETLNLTVGTVLDSFATITSPDWGVAGSTAPTFTWQAPASLPVGGVAGYQVALSGVTDTPWVSANLPATTFTVAYTGSTALTRGFTYPWSVTTFDAAGNSAENRDGLVMIDANISGKVTDFSGNPIEGATVTVYLTTGSVYTNIPSSVTRADGSYYIGGLNTASYRIRYSKDGRVVWYSNRLDASSVYDSYGNTYGSLKTGVNAVLTGWGAIEGKVVNSSNSGITGVTVQLLDASGQATSYPSVTTTAGGAFTFTLIAPGIYKMRVIGTGGYATLDYPYSVAVTDGYISATSDAVLQKINVTGTVTNSLGAPVPGVWVYLYTSAGLLVDTFPGAKTAADGTYVVAGVGTGNYKVLFDAGSSYAKQYYNHKATLDAADIITVGTTALSGINAVLGSGKPTVTTFTVPATSSSLTVSGITFTASEPTYGVAGYMITESASAPSASDSGWKSTAPTSYTFTGVGEKTLYAWAKGATGLISDSVARSVTVDASAVTPGDSDGNGVITISEVKLALDMYLGVQPSAYFVDTDKNGSVSLQEVQKVINSFLAQ